MTITYPLTAPSRSSQKQSSVIWTECGTVVVKKNPYSQVRQVQNWLGEYWEIQVSIDPMTRADAQEWMAFLSSLRNGQGTFYFGDELMSAPLAGSTCSPYVKDAGNVGYTLPIAGGTANAHFLSAGDFFSVEECIYRNLTDATFDASGEVTLDIWPHARQPQQAAGLTTTGWKGIFYLDSNRTVTTDSQSNGLYPIDFTACEAL